MFMNDNFTNVHKLFVHLVRKGWNVTALSWIEPNKCQNREKSSCTSICIKIFTSDSVVKIIFIYFSSSIIYSSISHI